MSYCYLKGTNVSGPSMTVEVNGGSRTIEIVSKEGFRQEV